MPSMELYHFSALSRASSLSRAGGCIFTDPKGFESVPMDR